MFAHVKGSVVGQGVGGGTQLKIGYTNMETMGEVDPDLFKFGLKKQFCLSDLEKMISDTPLHTNVGPMVDIFGAIKGKDKVYVCHNLNHKYPMMNQFSMSQTLTATGKDFEKLFEYDGITIPGSDLELNKNLLDDAWKHMDMEIVAVNEKLTSVIISYTTFCVKGCDIVLNYGFTKGVKIEEMKTAFKNSGKIMRAMNRIDADDFDEKVEKVDWKFKQGFSKRWTDGNMEKEVY